MKMIFGYPSHEKNTSAQMTGKLLVDSKTVINPSIVGGGVNFAFSDYVYIDLTTGSGFSRQIPYSSDPKEEEQLWDEYFTLADFMGMQYVRLQVGYTQWDPIGGVESGVLDMDNRFVFSPHFKDRPEAALVPENTYLYMDRMYRILDYFEKKGIYVSLGNWSGGTSAAGFCPNQRGWLMKETVPGRKGLNIASVVDFADSFAGIMYHLIVEKGYTCVKGFSIFNEPEHFVNYAEELSEVYNTCAERLEMLGIRDRVVIQAVDGPVMWTMAKGDGTHNFQDLLDRCADSMDSVAIHHYQSTLESGEALPSRVAGTQGTITSRFMKDLVLPTLDMAGERPVFVAELGTFSFCDNNTSSEGSSKHYGLPLFNAEASCIMFNSGVKGYGLWDYNTVIHPYFTMLAIDEEDPKRFVPDSMNYYPNALMMKYLPNGTDIVSSEIVGAELDGKRRVFATIGVRGDETTVLLVNDSDESAEITVSGVSTEKPYTYWYVEKDHTDQIYTEGSARLDEEQEVYLRPRSITVLTTYSYGASKVF